MEYTIVSQEVQYLNDFRLDSLLESISMMNPYSALVECEKIDLELTRLDNQLTLNESTGEVKDESKMKKLKNMIISMIEKVATFVNKMYNTVRVKMRTFTDVSNKMAKLVPIYKEHLKNASDEDLNVEVTGTEWDLSAFIKDRMIYERIVDKIPSLHEVPANELKNKIISIAFKGANSSNYLKLYGDKFKGDKITFNTGRTSIGKRIDVLDAISETSGADYMEYTAQYKFLLGILNDFKKKDLTKLPDKEVQSVKKIIASVQMHMNIITSIYVKRNMIIKQMLIEVNNSLAKPLGKPNKD